MYNIFNTLTGLPAANPCTTWDEARDQAIQLLINGEETVVTFPETNGKQKLVHFNLDGE